MPIDKRFNRSAYDRYQQLKAKLLSLGYFEVDIQLRMDEIFEDAGNLDQRRGGVLSNAPPGSPRMAFDFFGYVLICVVEHAPNSVIVRVTRLHAPVSA